ncbi:hypothetical protein [Hirschia litorea]|uniref:Lipoprotein n=1 Tax=Hirschia litorea TaxID=1199156 RepID=A0ABW2ILR8_9PROT
MSRRFFVGLIIGTAFLSSGCATVAVFENVTETEIQLTKPQSQLRKASIAFCEASRDAEWASGESNFSSLMRIWGGENEVGTEYWARLTKFESPVSEIVEQISYDVEHATLQLSELNKLAQTLLPSHGAETKPRNADVREFERVLIHAGQARETFAMSFLRAQEANEGQLIIKPAAVLEPLDQELDLARSIANGLAASRMSDALALLKDPLS